MVARRGLLCPKDLEARHLPREYQSRMAAAGILQKVERGLYGLSQANASPFHSLAEVGATVPKGVICLLSALRFHGCYSGYERNCPTGQPWTWICPDQLSAAISVGQN